MKVKINYMKVKHKHVIVAPLLCGCLTFKCAYTINTNLQQCLQFEISWRHFETNSYIIILSKQIPLCYENKY